MQDEATGGYGRAGVFAPGDGEGVERVETVWGQCAVRHDCGQRAGEVAGAGEIDVTVVPEECVSGEGGAAGASGEPAGSENGGVFEIGNRFFGGVCGAGEVVVHTAVVGAARENLLVVVRGGASEARALRGVFGGLAFAEGERAMRRLCRRLNCQAERRVLHDESCYLHCFLRLLRQGTFCCESKEPNRAEARTT